MPSPIPKSPATRQRRNKAPGHAVLPSTGRPKRRPSLPAHIEWHEMTKAWWQDIWHSPMAAEFLDVDKHALFRLAVLVNAFWERPSKELHGEIRLGSQAFGLTPIDRRRLQWEVGRVESARKKPSIQPQTGDDPRERLRVVK